MHALIYWNSVIGHNNIITQSLHSGFFEIIGYRATPGPTTSICCRNHISWHIRTRKIAMISSIATRQVSTTLRLRLSSTSLINKSTTVQQQLRRFSKDVKDAATKEQPPKSSSSSSSSSSSWWDSAEFWGRCGALAGWGMSGAAIYDALESSPELISLNMTGVLLVYSSLFARWAFIVKPQNLLLAGCHITNVAAQANQLRRAVEYKQKNGKDEEVNDILQKAAATVVGGLACVVAGPTVQSALVNANLGPISTVAAADGKNTTTCGIYYIITCLNSFIQLTSSTSSIKSRPFYCSFLGTNE